MQICTKMRRRAWITTLAVFAVDRSAKKIALNRKEWRKALPLQNSVQLSVVNYCSSTMSGFAEIVRSSHYSPVFRLCMYTEVCSEKKRVNSTLHHQKRLSSVAFSTVFVKMFSNFSKIIKQKNLSYSKSDDCACLKKRKQTFFFTTDSTL